MFSANSSQVTDDKLFVEDVFSTYLYRGNGTTQTITNGIDLAGKGGLVWIKDRTIAQNNNLYDTVRGATKMLTSNSAASQYTLATSITAFTGSGFTTGSFPETNENGSNFASWTFREAPKFLDIVTYTGNGANRNIAHNLGVAPGMMIVKRTDSAADWQVYHRSNANTQYQVLNSTAAVATGTTRWNSTTPTATEFTVGTDATVNASGGTYVAYLFAHDATSDGLIQCGTFTTSDGVSGLVNVGFEPQWVLIKRTDSSTLGDWQIYDNMRGMVASNNGGTFVQSSQRLQPNTSAVEATEGYGLGVYQQGFNFNNASGTSTYIYVAIRRGPMRTPTLGTSVFSPIVRTGTGAAGTVTTGFNPDLVFDARRDSATIKPWFDKLRGATRRITSTGTDAEASDGATYDLTGWTNTGYKIGFNAADYFNQGGGSYVDYALQRAPGFMDVVCYTSTGSNLAVAHNLGVTPELIITKRRSSTSYWAVDYDFRATTVGEMYLNLTNAGGSDPYSSTHMRGAPTASQFQFGDFPSGQTWVSYLFASCPGVSKVGNYTGNGSSQTINCGFAAGARFVMIKRTDSTGDWYVWDTARGIVAANDPHLSLNTTAAEVTTDDSVDTDSSGFVVNQVAATNVNVSSATYIYLAIA